jgi:acyl-CoA thioesterase-1
VRRLRIIARKNGWLFALACLACRRGGNAPAASPPPDATPDVRPSADRAVVLFLGDSLTAGYGLDPEQAYPALIQKKIDDAALPYRVVNGGVSGETSAGARRRVDWLLRPQPVSVLVIETGANDGLRGVDPDAVRANIQAIIDRAREQTPPPRLLLLGMQALPNYGADYGRRFRAIYPELARRNGAALMPFLLEGVGGVAALNQPDGVHPTAKGQRLIAENVWNYLRPLLEGVTTSSPAAAPIGGAAAPRPPARRGAPGPRAATCAWRHGPARTRRSSSRGRSRHRRRRATGPAA